MACVHFQTQVPYPVRDVFLEVNIWWTFIPSCAVLYPIKFRTDFSHFFKKKTGMCCFGQLQQYISTAELKKTARQITTGEANWFNETRRQLGIVQGGTEKLFFSYFLSFCLPCTPRSPSSDLFPWTEIHYNCSSKKAILSTLYIYIYTYPKNLLVI